jgi:hypothetical protein
MGISTMVRFGLWRIAELYVGKENPTGDPSLINMLQK